MFGRGPFSAAHTPIDNKSTAAPRDRLEPLIGREILHASAIDVLPQGVPKTEEWENRGLLLSLAGDPVDIAVAAEATPEFRQVDEEGHYIFSVFERFALRIKDRKAIVALAFEA